MIAPTPPENLAAERDLVGAILRGGRLPIDRVLGLVEPSDFRSELLASVFRVAVDLHRAGREVDVTLIAPLLSHAARDLLLPAFDAVVTWTNAPEYAKAVRDASVARQATAIIDDARAAASAVDPSAWIDAVVTKLRALQTSADPAAPVLARVAAKRLLAHIDDARKGAVDTRFVPTGIDLLDAIVTGFRAGQLSIAAARTSIGKSVLALQVAENAAYRCGVSTLFVSLEMPNSPDLASRLLAPHANVPAWKMLQRPGQVTDAEYANISRAVTDSQAPLAFWDPPRLTISRLAARARQMAQSEAGLGLVVLDYLGLLDPSDVRTKGGTREREVAEQSRELKALAMELSVPVVAVVQLNRQAEGREGQAPRLHDLRESGSLEMDAYLVLLLSRLGHRDEKRVLIDVAKHRNGSMGRVECRLDTDAMRLVDAKVA